jgi:hypothetical protein
MFKILLSSVLFVINFSIADATNTQWYWISVPSNPMTGYFSEGPNTLGMTIDSNIEWASVNGRPVISTIRTPLPYEFMVVMNESEYSNRCSGELKKALGTLRDFDSNNEIVSTIKSSELINEESYSHREKLLSKISNDAKNCLEEERNQLKDEEESIGKERELQNVAEQRIKQQEQETKLILTQNASTFDTEEPVIYKAPIISKPIIQAAEIQQKEIPKVNGNTETEQVTTTSLREESADRVDEFRQEPEPPVTPPEPNKPSVFMRLWSFLSSWWIF